MVNSMTVLTHTGLARPNRFVLLDDPYNQPEEGRSMQFRLTYEGLLFATQRDPLTGQQDKRGTHKHSIRQVFHDQLRHLWDIVPFLKAGGSSGPGIVTYGGLQPLPRDIASLSARHSLYGWNFVPLVTQDLSLLCGLDILFLRPDRPGTVLRSGDIDNRLKTLFDALRIPEAGENYSQNIRSDDEKPFFCLLEDDKLITKVSVETDQLLQFVTPRKDLNEVRLVVTVTLRPYEIHLGNMQFG
jgi:hypothetical protein